MTLSRRELAQYFDHTALKPDVTTSQIEQLCREAMEHQFFGVCVNSCHIAKVAELLSGTEVVPLSVVGFPLGAMNTESKQFETSWSIDNGALEIDTVVNLGAYFDHNESLVRQDIAAVVKAADDIPVKVILETSFLNSEQIAELSKWSCLEGAKFVKTSTGFGARGASVQDIKCMREALESINYQDKVGIKASGGIRDLKSTLALIEAGATRIGASASVDILKEFSAKI